MVEPTPVHPGERKPTAPNPDKDWVDWLVEAAWDYKAVVLVLPGNEGLPQAFLIPRRMN